MNRKKPANKSALAVAFSFLLILILVICFFVFGQSSAEQDLITLPETRNSEASDQPDDIDISGQYVQITPENVLSVLHSVDQPRYYHQSYCIELGENAVRNVELWVRSGLYRVQIDDGRQIKHLMSDGVRIWVWYEGDQKAACVTMSYGITLEDLIGLPSFDYLTVIENTEVSEAEYLVLDDGSGQNLCIFVSTAGEEQSCFRYWIELETGLLYQADCLENSTPVYQLKQTGFDRLANNDEIFADRFILPDGTSLLTEET